MKGDNLILKAAITKKLITKQSVKNFPQTCDILI